MPASCSHYKMKNIILAVAALILFTACSSSTPKEERPSAQSMLEERASTKPSPAAPVSPVPPPRSAEPQVPYNPDPALAKSEILIGKVPPKTEIWRLKKGKLEGPFAFGHPTQLSKTKNKKTPGYSIETCFRYATYSVVELKSQDEVGSAELAVRHDPPKGFALCLPEFKGNTSNIRIIEGYFAGVAGGLILIDGADSTEGQTEFQLIDAESGTEVFKGFHHPTEDFAIIKTGDAVSIEYFAKLPVKCELANEGEKCWKKVLSENKVVGKTPMPDCAGEFDKTKTARTEPALVFTRARIGKPGSPPKFLGGKATCQPAP